MKFNQKTVIPPAGQEEGEEMWTDENKVGKKIGGLKDELIDRLDEPPSQRPW